MIDVLRKYMDSLSGVSEMRRDRAEKFVSELQKRGEVRARDLQKAAQQVVDRSKRNREELVRLIRKEIRRQVQTLGLATKDDVERVARRVRALESEQKSTRSRSSSSSRAKSTTKSTAKSAKSPQKSSKSTQSTRKR